MNEYSTYISPNIRFDDSCSFPSSIVNLISTKTTYLDLSPQILGGHQTLCIYEHAWFYVILSFICSPMLTSYSFWWPCVKWSGATTQFRTNERQCGGHCLWSLQWLSQFVREGWKWVWKIGEDDTKFLYAIKLVQPKDLWRIVHLGTFHWNTIHSNNIREKYQHYSSWDNSLTSMCLHINLFL